MAFIFRDGGRGSRDIIILTAVISNFTLFLIQKTINAGGSRNMQKVTHVSSVGHKPMSCH